MKSRISITIDPEVHRGAQRLARVQGTSVSGLVESLLSRQVQAASGSVVDKLVGSAQLREPAAGDDVRYEQLRRKYLKG